MEIFLLVIWTLIIYTVGALTGSDIKKAIATRRERKSLEHNRVVSGPGKPQNLYSEYTIEELESHRRYLEKDYQQNINYPYARASAAEKLKMVLLMLEWHYDTDGTRERRAQKERVQQDLQNFDEMYNAALKGVLS